MREVIYIHLVPKAEDGQISKMKKIKIRQHSIPCIALAFGAISVFKTYNHLEHWQSKSEANIVRTKAWTSDRRFDKISTGAADAKLSSRGFIWPGENLCYAEGRELIASGYKHLTDSYIQKSQLKYAPDRFFARRNIHPNAVETWVGGLTIIPSSFPINETRAHFYMNMGNVIHLVRFARENLGIPSANINILFDNATIPSTKHHILQRKFFEVALSEIPKANIVSRSDIKGLTWYVDARHSYWSKRITSRHCFV